VSIAFWTWLWGPLGLLLATPLTVCLVVLGKHVPGLEFVGDAVGRVAQHAQRFARSAKWWSIRQCGRLRMQAPDGLRGVRQ
jgi:hypothetical protein